MAEPMGNQVLHPGCAGDFADPPSNRRRVDMTRQTAREQPPGADSDLRIGWTGRVAVLSRFPSPCISLTNRKPRLSPLTPGEGRGFFASRPARAPTSCLGSVDPSKRIAVTTEPPQMGDPMMPPIEHSQSKEQPVVEPKPRLPKGAPRWETEARDRLRTVVRRVAKPLADLATRDANEGDTRLVVTDILTDGLGFDKYQDLTTEYLVKGEFADYGLRVDQQLVAFLETKRITTKLNTKHLRQVEMYALNEGVEWVILTNGARWQVYHIGVMAGTPVLIELALDVDLLSSESANVKADALFYISKEAFKRHMIDDLWREKVASSPRSLAATIMSDPVVDAIRKELRRRTSQQVSTAEIQKLLRSTVIRADCLD